MTTYSPVRDDSERIAEAVLALARDARRALKQAAAGATGRPGDVLAQLHRRAEALRGRIGSDRLQGARRWLDALQRQILAEQAPAEPRELALRLTAAPALRMAG